MMSGEQSASAADWHALAQTLSEQLRVQGIADRRVLDVMAKLPRHIFVPEAPVEDAYLNCPQQIGYGQTISQPYIVALMTQAAQLRGDEIVLEVGTGSGYQSAVLAKLCRRVITVERLADLSHAAAQRLENLGIDNVTCVVGDGTLGWPDCAPYHAILVTACARDVPRALVEQLCDRGRLIIPLGSLTDQILWLFIKRGETLMPERLCGCRFVPLIGQEGGLARG